MEKNLFTPRDKTGNRLRFTLCDADMAKIRRGDRWRATVTDLNTGKKYNARGASCGLTGCMCDAIVSEVTA